MPIKALSSWWEPSSRGVPPNDPVSHRKILLAQDFTENAFRKSLSSHIALDKKYYILLLFAGQMCLHHLTHLFG